MPPKKGNKKQDADGEESLTRVAIVNGDRYAETAWDFTAESQQQHTD